MQVKIEKNELVIRVPITQNPPPSKSGKSLNVYTSGGFKTFADVQVAGKPCSISLNVCVPAK